MDAFATGYNTLAQGGLTNIQTPNETTIQGKIFAPEDGLLYTSIPYDKGWSVSVDGKALPTEDIVALGNGGLLAAQIPAGTHNISLHFSPRGLLQGTAISLLALLLLIIIAFIQKLRKHKQPILTEQPVALLPAEPLYTTPIYSAEPPIDADPPPENDPHRIFHAQAEPLDVPIAAYPAPDDDLPPEEENPAEEPLDEESIAEIPAAEEEPLEPQLPEASAEEEIPPVAEELPLAEDELPPVEEDSSQALLDRINSMLSQIEAATEELEKSVGESPKTDGE
jgi:hypothetical protein